MGEDENIIKHDVVVGKIHVTDDEYLDNFDYVLIQLRNVLDAAISHNIRVEGTTYLESCMSNINLFNQFKDRCNFIARYNEYSVKQIRDLCEVLRLNVEFMEIVRIMRELNEMHNSKNIIMKDDIKDPEYSKTLLCQSHNTSGGVSNKFVKLVDTDLKELLDNEVVMKFLEEHGYF